MAEKQLFEVEDSEGNIVTVEGKPTVTVMVERKIKHPLYKKYTKRANRAIARPEKSRDSQMDDQQYEEITKAIDELRLSLKSFADDIHLQNDELDNIIEEMKGDTEVADMIKEMQGA